MQIIKPSVFVEDLPDYSRTLKKIERAARTCYKSENKISLSFKKFSLLRSNKVLKQYFKLFVFISNSENLENIKLCVKSTFAII
jgi:hypothetical protein